MHFFDSACQTLRSQPVTSAVVDYYRHYNAWAGRVKYAWGEKIDEAVARVRMKLPAGSKVARVELLRAEVDVPFRIAQGAITFTIPGIVDYEVAALHAS